jgi:HSP20 family molecular chaperone IbpA
MSPMTAHLHESEAEILIELELPAQVDEVEVTAVDRTVTVTGGCEPDPEGFGKHGTCSTAFHDELQLPADADLEHLTARFRPGTLELRAPRRKPRPRRITVHVPYRINGAASAD